VTETDNEDFTDEVKVLPIVLVIDFDDCVVTAFPNDSAIHVQQNDWPVHLRSNRNPASREHHRTVTKRIRRSRFDFDALLIPIDPGSATYMRSMSDNTSGRADMQNTYWNQNSRALDFRIAWLNLRSMDGRQKSSVQEQTPAEADSRRTVTGTGTLGVDMPTRGTNQEEFLAGLLVIGP
jgi:hypothetical protein